MATDQSPPRLNIIIGIAFVTVVVLVALKFVFGSYFTSVIEEAEASKFVPPSEITALHVDEAAKLNNSPAVPIDQAIQQLAAQGRLGSTAITPQPSDDVGPLTGWSHLHDLDPKDANGAAAAPAVTGATDAGATPTATGDAGATKNANATTDAGAPKPHAPTTAISDAGATH
jgi:hypothetical protein